MTLEARENAPIIPLSKVIERVTAATGVSIRTLRRIKQEQKQVDNGERNEFNTPNKIKKDLGDIGRKQLSWTMLTKEYFAERFIIFIQLINKYRR
jgi:hypothetical protein